MFMSSTHAQNHFGELIEQARGGPVHVQNRGRDVAVVLSPEEHARLLANGGAPQVNPLVAKLHAESVSRWDRVYSALAK